MKLGRPPFEPTAEHRRTVEEMTMCGFPQDRIASVFGCTSRTLRKHFKRELETGADRLRAEVIGGLFTLAGKGNVAALKRLEELGRVTEAGRAPKVVAPDGKKVLDGKRAEAVAASPRFKSTGPPTLKAVS